MIKSWTSIQRGLLRQRVVCRLNRQSRTSGDAADAPVTRIALRRFVGESSILLPSIGIVGMRIGSAGLSLAAGVIVARQLGAHDYGIYSWALAVMSLITVPSQLGLPFLVTRETVRAREADNWPLMKGLWLWSSAVVLMSTAATAFVVLGIGSHLTDAPHFRILIFATVLMAFMVMGNIRAAALRGLQHTVLGQLPEYVIRPAVNIAVLLAFLLISNSQQLTPVLAIAMQCVAAFAAFLLGTAMLWRLSPLEIYRCGRIEFACRQWASSAVKMTVATLLSVANQSVSVLMLSALASESEAGVYAAIGALSALTSFGLQAVALSVGPHLARLHARKDRTALQRLVRHNSRVVLVFAGPVAILLMFFGTPILGFLYGPDFIQGAMGLAILSGGQFVSASAGSVHLLLMMTGHETDAARCMGFATVVNVLTSALLVPRFGVTGAAVAATAALVIWSSSMSWFVRKRLQIEACGVLFVSKTNPYDR